VSDGPRVLIVEARFYSDIADALAAGAAAVLDGAGVRYERQPVPGAFEVPAAIALAMRAMDAGLMEHPFAGFVALGCVIRGETDHYEHICRETSRALMDLAVEHGIALGFGILTCPSHDHARERADPRRRNKGADAAAACLHMMAMRRHLRLHVP
jgi:6,7-dimethyl-8-ribityllumazine synthase